MASYKKMAELIVDNKGKLSHKLEGLTLPSNADEIKRLCIDYVELLTKKDSEYMNQLSLLEQDLLSPVLKVMETLYGSDIELSKKVSSLLTKGSLSQKEQTYKCTTKKSKKKLSKEYGPALVGATGGTLLATICKPNSWSVILLGSVVSSIIGKVLYSLCIDKNISTFADADDTNTKYPEYPLCSADIDSIIKGLETAGECIDKVLLIYRRHLDIVQDDYSHKLALFTLDKKYIGILECYQTVLGNMFSIAPSPIVKDTIKQINNSLTRQGYKAVHYTADLRNLFEIKIGDCSEPEEFKPAIVKTSHNKETLILKGEVVLPE